MEFTKPPPCGSNCAWKDSEPFRKLQTQFVNPTRMELRLEDFQRLGKFAKPHPHGICNPHQDGIALGRFLALGEFRKPHPDGIAVGRFSALGEIRKPLPNGICTLGGFSA
jgi:hypothetical protein